MYDLLFYRPNSTRSRKILRKNFCGITAGECAPQKRIFPLQINLLPPNNKNNHRFRRRKKNNKKMKLQNKRVSPQYGFSTKNFFFKFSIIFLKRAHKNVFYTHFTRFYDDA